MYCFSHRFTYFHVFMISLVFNIFNFLTYMYVSRNGLRLYAMTKHTVNCKDCTRSLGGFTEWTGLAMPQEINFTRTSNSATTMSLKSFPVRMWVMTRARVRLISSAGISSICHCFEIAPYCVTAKSFSRLIRPAAKTYTRCTGFCLRVAQSELSNCGVVVRFRLWCGTDEFLAPLGPNMTRNQLKFLDKSLL